MSSSEDPTGSLERQWSLLEAAATSGQLLLATVIAAEQDGLIVSVQGIRGLVPLSQLLMLTGEGIDGLVHTSQLASSPVNHPREVVAVGEQVKVLVLYIDKEKQKISLSMKRA